MKNRALQAVVGCLIATCIDLLPMTPQSYENTITRDKAADLISGWNLVRRTRKKKNRSSANCN
jgi:hypothetical protein